MLLDSLWSCFIPIYDIETLSDTSNPSKRFNVQKNFKALDIANKKSLDFTKINSQYVNLHNKISCFQMNKLYCHQYMYFQDIR